MLTTLAARNWGMFVLRGILALALGVLVFAAPAPSLVALIFVFATYAIVDGFFAIAFGATAPGGPRWLLVIAGILGIAIGAYTVVSPQVTAVALVLLIGSFAVVRGVAEVGTAIWLRNHIENEWLYVLSGIVSIAFGTFLIVAPVTVPSRSSSPSASTRCSPVPPTSRSGCASVASTRRSRPPQPLVPPPDGGVATNKEIDMDFNKQLDDLDRRVRASQGLRGGRRRGEPRATAAAHR